MRTVRAILTDAELELLFQGAMLRFTADGIELQIVLAVDMREMIEKAMLAMLPTSPTLN